MTADAARATRFRLDVRDGWARFDGPAGTQMVDIAIDAMAEWAASGVNANSGGRSPRPTTATRCSTGRDHVAELLGATPGGVCFGANMTTLTLAFTRRRLGDAAPRRPGGRHPPRPRRQRHAVAPGDRDRRCRARAGAVRPGERACSTRPRSSTYRRAHALGRRHRGVEPHRHHPRPRARSSPPPTTPAPVSSSTRCTSRRIAASTSPRSGCDVLVTSPYKWYGPPRRRPGRRSGAARRLPVAKVRPAADRDRGDGRRARPTSRRSPPSTPPPASSSTRTSTDWRRPRRRSSHRSSRDCSRSPACGSGGRRRRPAARRRSPSPSTATSPPPSPRPSPMNASRRGPVTRTPSRLVGATRPRRPRGRRARRCRRLHRRRRRPPPPRRRRARWPGGSSSRPLPAERAVGPTCDRPAPGSPARSTRRPVTLGDCRAGLDRRVAPLARRERRPAPRPDHRVDELEPSPHIEVVVTVRDGRGRRDARATSTARSVGRRIAAQATCPPAMQLTPATLVRLPISTRASEHPEVGARRRPRRTGV